jgi:hypothetical protein
MPGPIRMILPGNGAPGQGVKNRNYRAAEVTHLLQLRKTITLSAVPSHYLMHVSPRQDVLSLQPVPAWLLGLGGAERTKEEQAER